MGPGLSNAGAGQVGVSVYPSIPPPHCPPWMHKGRKEVLPASPVWMSLWVSMVLLSLKVFPHSSHMKSLIPAGQAPVSS